MRLIRRRQLSVMHGFSFSIRTEWVGFILRCRFYAETNSLSVRANVRFRMRLVDAGTALRPLVNTVFFFSFFTVFLNHRIQSNQVFFSRYSAT